MQILLKLLLVLAGLLVLALVALNIWGAATLGTLKPDPDAERIDSANRVVMVFGASGSAGDGLLKAAMDDPDVQTVYAVTRRMSPRMEQGQASGRVNVIMHTDFTDYAALSDTLAEVNTVMWSLGATSIGMDEDTYRWIHVDFPTAFVKAWLAARTEGPMAFHNVTGMGTGEEQSAQWAQDKGRAEREVAEMAEGTGLRAFAHRSGWIRPPQDKPNGFIAVAELLLRSGHLMIPGEDLGGAMLEISARTGELPNGAIIDNKDARAYAQLYKERP